MRSANGAYEGSTSGRLSPQRSRSARPTAACWSGGNAARTRIHVASLRSITPLVSSSRMKAYRNSALALAAILAALAGAPSAIGDETPVPEASPLARRYTEGQTLVYRIRGSNHGRDLTTSYAAQARGFVRRDPGGWLYEEFAWIELEHDGKPIELPEASLAFRQRLSLTRDSPMQIPNLSTLHPALVPAVLDLLNFYGDLSLAGRLPQLRAAGDRAYFAHNLAHSWADGRVLLVGEAAVDFDVSLVDVKAAERTATVSLRHVQPTEPAIKISADWMRKPVAEGPNNWTQVRRTPAGKYVASIGREVVKVTLILDTTDGRLVSATLDNSVDVLERECDDFALARCGEPVRYRVYREVELLSGPASAPGGRATSWRAAAPWAG